MSKKKLSFIVLLTCLATLMFSTMAYARNLVDNYTVFVKNSLVLTIPSSNPGHINDFADLGNQGIRISIGEPKSVPAGNYTMRVMKNLKAQNPKLEAAIVKNIVSKDKNVRSVLDKVITKEVDAGFVYYSDAFIAGNKVKFIAIPKNIQVNDVVYPIAVLKNAKNPKLAKQFIYYVNSKQGQSILKQYGFQGAVKNPLSYTKTSAKFSNKEITVYAAASLKNAYQKIGKNFENLYGVKVNFQFDSSGSLRSKIENGAPVDVFASADLKNMKALQK